jgi:large subunit ribosomal protein L17
VVSELFRDVAPKIATRNGGYTRIIRTGYRLGDNAEMCLIELVDFNEIYTNEKAKKTTRRSRRSGGKKEDAVTSEMESVETVEEAVEETEVAEASTEESNEENDTTSEEENAEK